IKRELMKYVLITWLAVFTSLAALAQKNNIYVDAGISLARFYPGTSTTYNYNITRYLGVGAGFQAYDFHATVTNFQLVPAAFGEVRFNIGSKKKNKFFAFLDIGANFYKHTNNSSRDGNTIYYVTDDNGTYTGLGFGYHFHSKKPVWAHYVSLKIISNSYKANEYNLISSQR